MLLHPIIFLTFKVLYAKSRRKGSTARVWTSSLCPRPQMVMVIQVVIPCK